MKINQQLALSFEGLGTVTKGWAKPKQERYCETCQKSFYVEGWQKKRFCSLGCYGVSRGKPGPPKPRNGQEYPCKQCGKMFYRQQSQRRARNGRFCSRACFARAREKPVNLKCLECGAEIRSTPAGRERKKYCSKACYWKRAKANAVAVAQFKECGICKQSFIVKRPEQTYCSAECGQISRRNRVIRRCRVCDGVLYVKLSELETKYYCSQKCHYSDKDYRLKPGPGSRSIGTNGYVRIYWPAHPRCNKNGVVYEHRLVAEQKYGRPLQFGEHVHHINGIKHDNRPENLEIIGIGAHAAITSKESAVKRRQIKAELEAYRRKFGPLEE